MTNFHELLQSEIGDLTHLTRYDVQQYMKHLQDRGNKATTLNPKYSAIVTYVRYCRCSPAYVTPYLWA
jgi:integrase/recombinase XerD